MNVSGTKKSETDWSRVDAQLDEDVDTSDSPVLDKAFFERAELYMPVQQEVTLHIDADVLAWFQAQDNPQARISAALRLYAEVHKAEVHKEVL